MKAQLSYENLQKHNNSKHSKKDTTPIITNNNLNKPKPK